jgi:hypothetical protein
VYDRWRKYRGSAAAISWVKEFWNARESYDYQKTRSVLGTSQAVARMERAVDALNALGVLELGERLPSVDEADPPGVNHGQEEGNDGPGPGPGPGPDERAV